MESPFQPVHDETILYRSNPYRKWYDLVWRIGLGVIEVAVAIFFFLYRADLLPEWFFGILPPHQSCKRAEPDRFSGNFAFAVDNLARRRYRPDFYQ